MQSCSQPHACPAFHHLDVQLGPCDQCEQNATIAGSPSSWNYSVMEGCGWAIMTTDGNNTADNACRLQ